MEHGDLHITVYNMCYKEEEYNQNSLSSQIPLQKPSLRITLRRDVTHLM